MMPLSYDWTSLHTGRAKSSPRVLANAGKRPFELERPRLGNGGAAPRPQALGLRTREQAPGECFGPAGLTKMSGVLGARLKARLPQRA